MMRRWFIVSSSRIYLDVQYRGNCVNCCLNLFPFYHHYVGFLPCGSRHNVEMLFFFSVDIISILCTRPRPPPYLSIWDSSPTFGLRSQPPSIPSLCLCLIFSIVLQSTRRVLLFPLIICVKGFCFQAVSDHLTFLTLPREFFSGCPLFLPINNVNSLLIFTELTSHRPYYNCWW